MQSLLNHNTFGIDQGCNALYEPTSVEELRATLAMLCKEPLLVIGGGSNLLLTQDFEGNVLHPLIKGIEVCEKDTYILMRCGAGEVWDEVVDYAVSHGYYDMENLSHIPGEVGASVVQNIGAYGMEVQDVVYKIEAIETETGKEVVITPEECDYAYRYSKFKGEWKGRYVVTYVTYKLSKNFTPRLGYGNLSAVLQQKGIENPTASDVRRAVIDIRKSKLPEPEIEGNAGSFFMNPVVDRDKFSELIERYPNMPHYNVGDDKVKIPAGWMIEQCGWKGKSMGRAAVHDKQALVLVNKGGATGKEILALCDAIRSDVKSRFGIEIRPEVNIV
ncbi:MAG: UDP-N-acetylmuramate dehydrogenase [Prevotella sp.]|nr:UDP-N-acetylmuramate dehydrogenase [Prevotella sp.]